MWARKNGVMFVVVVFDENGNVENSVAQPIAAGNDKFDLPFLVAKTAAHAMLMVHHDNLN
jgi:hypothetical protein